MPDSPKYVDHPAPSTVAVLLLLGILLALLAGIPDAIPRNDPILWVVLGFCFAVLVFFMWPLYSTWYSINPEGLEIRYGPWTRRYPWSDFTAAYWQKGMFATRIGWPSMTPCVRFTDAVLLKRPGRRFGLYLTPNDSRVFLTKVAELAPELTKETLI